MTVRGCLLAAMLVFIVAADAPGPPEEILQRLDSTDYARREAAMTALLADKSLTEDSIASLYEQATTTEQRHRLLSVAQHHLLRRVVQRTSRPSQEGALGIKHMGLAAAQLPHLGQAAIAVEDTLPGFPAHGALRPGDLILFIDGQRLVDNARPEHLAKSFQAAIKNRKAGHRVRLTVRRGDKSINVRVRLASLDALEAVYSKSDGGLQKQWRSRWQRMRRELIARGPSAKALTASEQTALIYPDIVE